MLLELSSSELLGADLALDADFRTVSFNVLTQLASSQMLKLFNVANIAAKLRALIHLHVLLQLIYCFPLNI